MANIIIELNFYTGEGHRLHPSNYFYKMKITLTVVCRFLYPTFLDLPPTLAFWDQFAFHPTGSTSAAIISVLNTVSHQPAAIQSVCRHYLTGFF